MTTATIPSATAPPLCVDCQENLSEYDIRKRRLCGPCFVRYIGSKVLKRLDAFSFRSLSASPLTDLSRPHHRLFLPLSGGVSSLVLLEVLDGLLQRQFAKQGRTSFKLVVGHVDLDDGLGHTDDVGRQLEWYENIKRRFDTHNFLAVTALHEALSKDLDLKRGLQLVGIQPLTDESDAHLLRRTLFTASSSPTTRVDLEQLLLRRLVVATARENDCTGVLWGHSDDRLAALILSEVSKGRGGGVATVIAEGASSTAGIRFNFPLRDLFRSELDLYASSPLTGSLMGLVARNVGSASTTATHAGVSVRNTPIDALLTHYIASQAEKYPSIMANVVRTTGKLHLPNPSQVQSECCLCLMPVLASLPAGGEDELCQACLRIRQDLKFKNLISQ